MSEVGRILYVVQSFVHFSKRIVPGSYEASLSIAYPLKGARLYVLRKKMLAHNTMRKSIALYGVPEIGGN